MAASEPRGAFECPDCGEHVFLWTCQDTDDHDFALLGPGADMPEAITFYSVRDEYGCFSNFAPFPIQLGGKTWPTSEHFFQACPETCPPASLIRSLHLSHI
jgi:hypothetical protein